MGKASVLVLSITLCCAACASAQQREPGSEPAVSAASVAMPSERIRIESKALVDAFSAEVAKHRSASLDPAPEVVVENTPELIAFSFEHNRITVPTWETQPEPVKQVFRRFSGGDARDAGRFFELFFQQFLVVHEAAHWFQYRTWTGSPPEFYRMERDANRMAVAFWRTQPEGEAFLAQLEQLATRAHASVPDPTPPGTDAAAYFDQHYRELGADPIQYGYFQFRFIAEALKAREQLDFGRMAARPSSSNDVIAD